MNREEFHAALSNFAWYITQRERRGIEDFDSMTAGVRGNHTRIVTEFDRLTAIEQQNEELKDAQRIAWCLKNGIEYPDWPDAGATRPLTFIDRCNRDKRVFPKPEDDPHCNLRWYFSHYDADGTDYVVCLVGPRLRISGRPDTEKIRGLIDSSSKGVFIL